MAQTRDFKKWIAGSAGAPLLSAHANLPQPPTQLSRTLRAENAALPRSALPDVVARVIRIVSSCRSALRSQTLTMIPGSLHDCKRVQTFAEDAKVKTWWQETILSEDEYFPSIVCGHGQSLYVMLPAVDNQRAVTFLLPPRM